MPRALKRIGLQTCSRTGQVRFYGSAVLSLQPQDGFHKWWAQPTIYMIHEAFITQGQDYSPIKSHLPVFFYALDCAFGYDSLRRCAPPYKATRLIKKPVSPQGSQDIFFRFDLPSVSPFFVLSVVMAAPFFSCILPVMFFLP